MKIDLAIVARDLKLPPEKIEKTVELLDAGNTISFITRFRKDLTGGLDEQQILAVKQRVVQLRALSERKAFVLKSIDSQSKLTDGLKTQINKATSSRRLEDLYLPYKPKKQSRAALARQQGLEPFADDIFNGTSPDVDIATRATEFVRVDKDLNSVDDVIKGVGDLITERLSENDELRSSLRKIMWTEGKLTSVAIVTEPAPTPVEKDTPVTAPATAPTVAENAPAEAAAKTPEAQPAETVATPTTETTAPSVEPTASSGAAIADPPASAADPVPAADSAIDAPAETAATPSDAAELSTETTQATLPQAPVDSTPEPSPAHTPLSPVVTDDSAAVTESTTAESTTEPGSTEKTEAATPIAESPETNPEPTDAAAAAKPKKKKKKKKKKKTGEDPFKDYRDFKQPLKQVPNHRVLAINRGERASALKVKILVEGDKLSIAANEALVPTEHPFKEFLSKCATDALSRMMVPSLEREIRRELTELAEKHAVEVFANNLRNLLLQPPVRNKTVLAIDPGFKRGCSVAVLDPCGNLLDSGHVFVVGNQSRRDESKTKIAAWVKKYGADVIAIGNGAACRQTEQMVSDTIAEQLQDYKTSYAMVNEAGASIYSTSEIGREEMPDVSPSIRSAASIGRRLQDPLSELVKIVPASIGVGMYQHDVKAKHLSESLDEVVRFCVNRVGVDVNTASHSLLKYVSGLNSLTARRVIEHRQANGQFKNRSQLTEINGFGDATFVQSAGFLRIHNGDSPLDCTPIHPESYGIADDVLKQIDVSVEELLPKSPIVSIKAASPVAATTDSEPVLPASTPVDSTAATATDASPEPKEAAAPEEVAPESSTAVETSPTKITATAPATDNTSIEVASVEVNLPVDASTPTEPTADAEPASLASTESVAPAAVETVSTEDAAAAAAQRKENLRKISALDVDALAQKHAAGVLLVKDILLALKRPKWDPRDKVSKPIFRRGIIKADDLKPEMQLDGQVVNVVDFGVFVDIGLGESSLVHVSQLSNHFIRDPHRLYAIGDVLKVWVAEIDAERRRVKLTAIRPGSKKPSSRRPRSSSGNTGTAPNAGADGSSSATAASPAHKAGKYGTKFSGNARPNSGRRPNQRGPGKNTPHKSHVRRSKPKEIKPITDEMLKGDAPMRSFSDLAQFVNKKPDSKNKTGDKKDK